MKLHRLPKELEDSLAERSQDGDFQLFTSLRYDPHLTGLTRRIPIAMEDSDDDVFFLSRLHHQRLRYGLRVVKWNVELNHGDFVEKMVKAVDGSATPLKVRVCVDKSGAVEVTTMPIAERDNLFSGLSDTPAVAGSADPIYTVVADSIRSDPSLYTSIKTTKRDVYNDARRRAGICDGEAKEVLIVGPHGDILEGSTTSVAVYHGGEWITPPLLPGGAVGVLRSFLLELGFVHERPLRLQDLKDGDRMLIFNGVIGVCAGVFKATI